MSCRNIGLTMTEESGNDSIRFWDGKVYSEAQLDQVFPGLAAIVRANPVLAEQWPMWRFKCANTFLVISLGSMLLIALPAAIVWAVASLIYGLTSMGLDPLTPALFAAGTGLICGCFMWVGSCLAYPDYRPVVTVKDGTILARTASGDISITARIEDCCWYDGWASDTALCGGGGCIVLGKRAIIIRFPKQSRFGWRRRVAVGLTKEYHAIWKAFLTLAGVPQISDKWSEPLPNRAQDDKD